MKLFSVAIRQENDTFHAQIPDLPDVHVIGTSIADTIDKMRSALIDYLQRLADNDEPLPNPEHITNHITNPKYAGQTWAIISLGSMLFHHQQKTFALHLPRPLLLQIQEKVGDSELDVETFILEAIRQRLAQ